MTLFQVWAPRARGVELVTREQRTRLRRADGGWFKSDLPIVGEIDYAFALDGGPPLPDPRSPWQPDGVFGFSRTLGERRPREVTPFEPTSLPRAVFYELHVGTFTPRGTFRSATDRLDHLAALGVTHVELMPVPAFSGERGWGYDGVAPFAPHPAYGSPADLRELVAACHSKGLAVVFDVVHNHVGPEGNFLPRFGPYLAEGHTAWGQGPNLDGPDSDEVRRYFIDSALHWLREYGADGLRLDAVHALCDRSPTHFLEELRGAVDSLALSLGRPLFLVAESDANDPRLVRAKGDGGVGLDAIWNDDFHHALHSYLTGERDGYYADFFGCSDVVESLARGFVYAGRYSVYRRRRHGRADSRLSGKQLVGFAQNHDQIGNRPRGDRLAASLSTDRLMVAAGLVLTAPFIPLLFQGEEWGARTPFPFFCDYADRELRDAVRRGRRDALAACAPETQDVLDPCARETFLAAKLDWTELDLPQHQRVLAWTRALLALRAKTRAFAAGPLLGPEVRCSEKEGWIALRRGSHLVAAQLGRETASIPLERFGGMKLALASRHDCRVAGDRLELPPNTFAVLAPL